MVRVLGLGTLDVLVILWLFVWCEVVICAAVEFLFVGIISVGIWVELEYFAVLLVGVVVIVWVECIHVDGWLLRFGVVVTDVVGCLFVFRLCGDVVFCDCDVYLDGATVWWV